MKSQNVILALLILAFAFSNCKNNKPNYEINGKIMGIQNAKIYLKQFNGAGYSVVDSTNISNGSFSFKGNLQIPELFRLVPENNEGYISVFIENSNISINTDTGNLQKATISGSKSHLLLVAFWNSIDSIEKLTEPLEKEYEEAKLKEKKVLESEIERKIHSIYEAENNYIIDFVKINKSSPVAAYVLYKYLSGELEFKQIEELKTGLDTSILKSKYCKFIDIQIELLKRTQIGQKAPTFSLPDTSGNLVNLSQIKGKYLLIDFWASWCSPCRQENPNVVAAYHKYHTKGFNVLGVSFDSKRDRWIKAIQNDNLKWTHISDLAGWENAVGKLYGIRSIPSNVLIDSKGIIIAKNLRGKNLHDKLEELLK